MYLLITRAVGCVGRFDERGSEGCIPLSDQFGVVRLCLLASVSASADVSAAGIFRYQAPFFDLQNLDQGPLLGKLVLPHDELVGHDPQPHGIRNLSMNSR